MKMPLPPDVNLVNEDISSENEKQSEQDQQFSTIANRTELLMIEKVLDIDI